LVFFTDPVPFTVTVENRIVTLAGDPGSVVLGRNVVDQVRHVMSDYDTVTENIRQHRDQALASATERATQMALPEVHSESLRSGRSCAGRSSQTGLAGRGEGPVLILLRPLAFRMWHE
jgi:hypothetical protein